MRIAISGTHRVGKTSLAEALVSALPGYELVPEPYYALEEEGHEFGEMPSVDDFVLQLQRSLASVAQSEPNTIFDRCPLDIVAYIQTHQDAHAFDDDAWSSRVREAMAMLSLVVVVPIEQPDRIEVPRDERRLRAAVDERLADLVLDDRFAEDLEVLQVAGSLQSRLLQVLAVATAAR